MLRNSTHRLLSYQKCFLYRICVLPIALYNFFLWHYNKVPLLFPLNELRKLQFQATLWILDAFCTSPTIRIEAITSLIPIYLHLQKLSVKLQSRTSSLLSNHTVKSLLKKNIPAILFLICSL